MISSTNESINFISKEQDQKVVPVNGGAQTDLIQSLLYEIIRVKERIKYYERVPNGAGQVSVSILRELVAEAHNSLVNYDMKLMRKYFDLLQHCD